MFKLAVLLVCLQTAVFAHSEAASIKGILTDPSGAIIVGGNVILHPLAGTSAIGSTSDTKGRFVFQDLAPGDYLMDASAPGLALTDVLNIALAAHEAKLVDLKLSVTAARSQITVTAASDPQSLDQTSKQLDVVDPSAAEQTGLFSVGDALRFLPGLRVSTRGGPGSFTTIQTRGLLASGTAVIIDGFRFRDVTGIQGDASAYLGDLLLVDSSRIEVLQGSGSSLYGTNSAGGTVSLITDTGGGPIHGDLDLQGGGLGLFEGNAKVAGAAFGNRLNYSAGLANLNVTSGVDSGGVVRNWSGQGSLTYSLTPKIRIGGKFFLNTGFLQETISPAPVSFVVNGIVPAIAVGPNPTFFTSLTDPDAGRKSHFEDSLFFLDHQVTSRLSYRIGYALVDSVRDNRNGPAGPGFYQPAFNTSDKYSGRTDTLQARVNYVAGSHQVLTAGYEFEREHYLNVTTDQNPVVFKQADYRTDAHQGTNAAFAQDEIRLFSGRLQVLLSGRFTAASLDQPSFLGGGISPYANTKLSQPPSAYTGDASLAYFLRKSSTKLRSHFGNGFRLPSIYERFGGYLYKGYDYAYGDPRLAPERYVTGDFGIDQYLFRERLKVTATYFYNQLQEIIGFYDFPPGYVDPFGRSGGYYNERGGISRGVELSGQFRPDRRTILMAAYTHTNAQDRTSQYFTGTAVDPVQTPRILPNAVTVTAMRQLGHGIDLAMDFQGGSDYLYPLYGYAFKFAGPRELGVSGGYTHSWSERLSTRFYFRVSNTLNQNYFDDGFQTPRRWAVGGVHLGF